jgi:hypothetical protein
MNIITDDVTKINYDTKSYNIQPMEDNTMSNYIISDNDSNIDDLIASDIENNTDGQYYLSINEDNKVVQTKFPLKPKFIEKFQTDDNEITFSNMLLIFIIIMLIILIVNYFFKYCNSNSNFLNSSSS